MPCSGSSLARAVNKAGFWNVNSCNDQTPVTQNDKGVFLVSGCSPSIFEKAVKDLNATGKPVVFLVKRQDQGGEYALFIAVKPGK